MQNTKDKEQQLKKLYKPFTECAMCPLGKLGRTQVVFGAGNANAKLLLLGEGPGKEEDLHGLPFIGRSGKILDAALSAADIKRSDVYITNIVKCRPPNNRKPLPIESATCKSLLLDRQLEVIRPKIICTLGSSALEGLIKTKTKITQIRGTLIKAGPLIILPTLHPAYVLRNPKEMSTLISDLKKAKTLAEKTTFEF